MKLSQQSLIFSKQYSNIKLKYSLQRLLIVFILFSSHFSFGQYKIPDVPSKANGEQTSVYDYIDLLESGQKTALEQKLIKYSDTTSTQIVVAIIPSTNGEYINYLGAQWAEEWGIGDQDKDNGIFILLARDDRKISISTGYGTEHLMTDAMSRRIIERDIIPYFKKTIIMVDLIVAQMLFLKSCKENTKAQDNLAKVVFLLVLFSFYL